VSERKPEADADAATPPRHFEKDAWGRVLGMELLDLSTDRVRVRIDVGPQHHQPYGIVHGGVYCSIVEGVASYGAGHAARMQGEKGVVGVANSTDFLRSHSTGELVATGEPIHSGKSLRLWGVTIRRSSDDKVVARGQVRFHVLTELPDERRPRMSEDA
jgi:1,4-dihydroxy-2-naphthoyl-CoA hydrolase